MDIYNHRDCYKVKGDSCTVSSNDRGDYGCIVSMKDLFIPNFDYILPHVKEDGNIINCRVIMHNKAFNAWLVIAIIHFIKGCCSFIRNFILNFDQIPNTRDLFY